MREAARRSKQVPTALSTRCLICLIAALGTLFVALGRTLPSSASVPAEGGIPLYVGSYSHEEGSGCNHRIDPVGAYFYGNGSIGRTENHIGFHTQWGNVIADSQQDFADAGVCRPEHEERANGS